MNASRHAAPDGGSRQYAGALRTSIALVAIASAAVVTAVGAIAIRVARRVVTPAPRLPDTRIVAVDAPAQTVTLARTPDTELPGRYGLFTTGSKSYVKLGQVLSSDATSVTRKLLTHVGAGEQLAPTNVVVLGTEYGASETDARSPEAMTLGTGSAWVFTRGRLVQGTWTRAERTQSWQLLDADGAPILLTPGPTWVELPETGAIPRVRAVAPPVALPAS